MKKIISVLSLLSIISSNVLTFGTNINSQIQTINHITSKNNNNNRNSDIQQGIFWYAPNIKINSLSDNAFANNLQASDEQNYYDFVFLKSLAWDDNKKTINSSIDNIKTKEYILNDLKDQNQDLIDYQQMQKVKDQNGNLVIDQGLSLVNRYLNNGLLEFKDNGNIPSRKTYFSSLLSNNIADQAKQTVIVDQFSSLKKFILSDYLSVNLHWYGIDFTLEPKLISTIMIDIINAAIQKISNVVKKDIDLWTNELAISLKTEMFAIAEQLMFEMDLILVEQPEIVAILDPSYTAISYAIAKGIGSAFQLAITKVIDGVKNIADQTIKNMFDNSQGASYITRKIDPSAINFVLEINLHWSILNSQINLIPVFPQVYTPNILVPAHPSLIFDNVANALTGSNNDFTLIMNEDDWSEFVNWTSHDTKWNSYDGGNAWLHYLNLNNSNIILNNDEWKLILKQLTILDVPEGYAICIHVIQKLKMNFQITYTNLTVQDKNNMPLPKNGQPWLKTSFIGDENSNNLMITTSQFRNLLSVYDYATKNANAILTDYNKNPNNYNDIKIWFYHTYVVCDTDNTKNNVAMWKNNQLNELTIESLFEKYYQDFYLQNYDNKLNFANFIANTADNNNQILNIPNINL